MVSEGGINTGLEVLEVLSFVAKHHKMGFCMICIKWSGFVILCMHEQQLIARDPGKFFFNDFATY